MSSDLKVTGKDAVNEVSARMSKVEAELSRDIKTAHEMYGRQQAMSSISKLLTVAETVETQQIKESKAYKYITNPTDPEGGNFKRWDDYCQVALGLSRAVVDEKILNLKVFGQAAIDGMSTIGLGTRQLRQLRKLPDDKIDQAKVLAEENDVESLHDLIEEYAAEKKQLKEELAEKQETVDFYIEKVTEKDKKINQINADLVIKRKKMDGWELQVDEMNIAITTQSGLASKHMDNLDLLLDQMMHLTLDEDHKEAAMSTLASTYIAGLKNRLIQADAMWNKAMSLIGAYEDRALPLLDQKIVDQAQQTQD